MSENLVFVIGAGASQEVGLPTGVELKQTIAQLLNIKFEHGVRLISGDALIKKALEEVQLKGVEIVSGSKYPYC